MTYVVDPETCTGCGSCVVVCPADAIALDEECACVGECPAGGIAEAA